MLEVGIGSYAVRPCNGDDKNGVSPKTISLPSGPGSIEGLGESFQPSLNTGSARYAIAIQVPPGTNGHQPVVVLNYDSGFGCGILGLGWSIDPGSVTRQTDKGLPLYVDGSNGLDDDHDGLVDEIDEVDTFIDYAGEELVPLSDGSFRTKVETDFTKYLRTADYWTAYQKDGGRLTYGRTPSARVMDATGARVFKWLLEKSKDTNGNSIEYCYTEFPTSDNQKYLRMICYGPGGGPWDVFYFMYFGYEDRPDWRRDYRSGFLVKTTKRLKQIYVGIQGTIPPSCSTGDWNNDGVSDALIRQYRFAYEDGSGSCSFLSSVTQVGSDANSTLPAISFEYSEFEPDTVFCASGKVIGSSNAPYVVMDNDSVDLLDLNSDSLPDILKTDYPGGRHTAYVNLGMHNSPAGRSILWDNGQVVGAADGFASNLTLSDETVHLADMDGNGRADLVYTSPWKQISYHLNQGDASWGKRTYATISDTSPPSPFADEDTDLSDLDFDKRIDIVKSTSNGYSVWFNLDGGTYSREVRTPGAVYEGRVIRFSDTAVHLADMNGDRINDVVKVTPTRLIYCLNKGHGYFDESISVPIPDCVLTSGQNGQVEKSRLEDINGDGLADLIIERATVNELWYWLNRGTDSFSSRHIITDMPQIYNPNVAVRWADINGNGTTDLIYADSFSQSKLQVIDIGELVGGCDHLNLLTSIDNGLGTVTNISYSSSTQLYVDDSVAGDPWETTLPFPVHVVTHVATKVATVSGSEFYEATYSYHSGYYDEVEKEFRGFARERTVQPGDSSAPTVQTTSWFHTGQTNEALKGKLIALETADIDDRLFLRAENLWVPQLVDTGIDQGQIFFAYNKESVSKLYEGGDTPVTLKSSFEYDDYGNLTAERDYGIINPCLPTTDPNHFRLGDDEILVLFEYICDVNQWMLCFEKSRTITDLDGNIKARTRSYYDNLPLGQISKGNMTRQEDWLNTQDRFVPTLTNEYDSFGNITRIANANNHARTLSYDPLLHIYPVAEIIELQDYNLPMMAEYNYGFGLVSSATDFTGAEFSYDYDVFGRLTEVNKPGGAKDMYQYHLGSPLSCIVTQSLENIAGDTYDSYSYFDGLGRKLGTKVEAEPEGDEQRWRYIDVVSFNQRRLTQKSWLPYFTADHSYEVPDPCLPYVSYQYDVSGRTIKTTNPDGTFSSVVHEALAQHFYDECDNDPCSTAYNTPKSLYHDGQERLIRVIERNGLQEYLTSYAYTTLGDLARITDAHNNVKILNYDSLRRKTFINDTDRGRMTYQYDNVGNLIRTVDAKSQAIEYTYDFAERLKTENYLNQSGDANDPADVIYNYDLPSRNVDFGDGTIGTATFTAGRLASVIDLSGEEHISYDALGNNKWVVKRILDPKAGVLVSYKTAFDYDLLNRVTDVYYPDNDHVEYTYNSGSLVETIGGGPGGREILSNVDCGPASLFKSVSFGNGVVTSYEYDNRNRLNSLITAATDHTELINFAYQYDPVSNIKSIIDNRPYSYIPKTSPRRNTQVFQYDDLYRLTQVHFARRDDLQANFGQIDYAYDAIGNMLSKTSADANQPGHIDDDEHVNLGAMNYAGGTSGRIGRNPGDLPGPHALTSTENGAAYEYDDNGNMTSIDGAVCTWDFKDRLIRYRKDDVDARYTYDYTGRRITKLVTKDGLTTQTLYPNRAFEVRPNQAPTKFVFNGSNRVARVKGALDPSRKRIQRIWLNEGKNLVCLVVRSSQTIGEIFGMDSSAFTWDGLIYQPVSLVQKLDVGEPVWVDVPSARVVNAVGAYDPRMEDKDVPAGRSLQAWPRLEPFVPSVHLLGQADLNAYDAFSGSWLHSYPALPQFVSNMPSELPAGLGFWCAPMLSATITSAPTESHDVLFYHTDHLGSSSVITDINGVLVQETANYPFGYPRDDTLVDPNNPFRADYKFTGKEQDKESRFVYFEARYYSSTFNRFVTTDPLATEELSQEWLSQPTRQNPYNYGLNNPLKYKDVDGSDAILSIQGNTITIRSTLYISGPSATAEQARALQTQLMSSWNAGFLHTGPFKSGWSYTRGDRAFRVQFDIQVRNLADAGLSAAQAIRRSGANVIQLNQGPSLRDVLHGQGTPNPSYVYGGRVGKWWSGWLGKKVGIHEFGHIVGLEDRYRPGANFGENFMDFAPHPGYKWNVMGNPQFFFVRPQNIRDILDRALQAGLPAPGQNLLIRGAGYRQNISNEELLDEVDL
jgi:RHS repeat-associated protein